MLVLDPSFCASGPINTAKRSQQQQQQQRRTNMSTQAASASTGASSQSQRESQIDEVMSDSSSSDDCVVTEAPQANGSQRNAEQQQQQQSQQQSSEQQENQDHEDGENKQQQQQEEEAEVNSDDCKPSNAHLSRSDRFRSQLDAEVPRNEDSSDPDALDDSSDESLPDADEVLEEGDGFFGAKLSPEQMRTGWIPGYSISIPVHMNLKLTRASLAHDYKPTDRVALIVYDRQKDEEFTLAHLSAKSGVTSVPLETIFSGDEGLCVLRLIGNCAVDVTGVKSSRGEFAEESESDQDGDETMHQVCQGAHGQEYEFDQGSQESGDESSVVAGEHGPSIMDELAAANSDGDSDDAAQAKKHQQRLRAQVARAAEQDEEMTSGDDIVFMQGSDEFDESDENSEESVDSATAAEMQREAVKDKIREVQSGEETSEPEDQQAQDEAPQQQSSKQKATEAAVAAAQKRADESKAAAQQQKKLQKQAQQAAKSVQKKAPKVVLASQQQKEAKPAKAESVFAAPTPAPAKVESAAESAPTKKRKQEAVPAAASHAAAAAASQSKSAQKRRKTGTASAPVAVSSDDVIVPQATETSTSQVTAVDGTQQTVTTASITVSTQSVTSGADATPSAQIKASAMPLDTPGKPHKSVAQQRKEKKNRLSKGAQEAKESASKLDSAAKLSAQQQAAKGKVSAAKPAVSAQAQSSSQKSKGKIACTAKGCSKMLKSNESLQSHLAQVHA